jgi:hypothetical protein
MRAVAPARSGVVGHAACSTCSRRAPPAAVSQRRPEAPSGARRGGAQRRAAGLALKARRISPLAARRSTARIVSAMPSARAPPPQRVPRPPPAAAPRPPPAAAAAAAGESAAGVLRGWRGGRERTPGSSPSCPPVLETASSTLM